MYSHRRGPSGDQNRGIQSGLIWGPAIYVNDGLVKEFSQSQGK